MPVGRWVGESVVSRSVRFESLLSSKRLRASVGGREELDLTVARLPAALAKPRLPGRCCLRYGAWPRCGSTGLCGGEAPWGTRPQRDVDGCGSPFTFTPSKAEDTIRRGVQGITEWQDGRCPALPSRPSNSRTWVRSAVADAVPP